jgi:hypothetical protein
MQRHGMDCRVRLGELLAAQKLTTPFSRGDTLCLVIFSGRHERFLLRQGILDPIRPLTAPVVPQAISAA